MKILGFDITRQKAMQPVNDWRHGWRVIHEPYTGAWQKNDELKRGDLTCYPALFACLSRISQDIGTMPFVLKTQGSNDIWTAVENSAYSPVLRKPNNYETDQQFREHWVLSLLTDGNCYVLKERDNRGVVTKLYILDPCRVETLVSESGRAFYRLNYGTANNLLPESYDGTQVTIPQSEVIHHRINCLHHPLIGIPPLCAAALASGKNLEILRNSASFFRNGARPGGILTVPAGLQEGDADTLAAEWQRNYTGAHSGRVAILGADVKYTAIPTQSSLDSQLVAQLEYSDRQICQPFHIPPYIVGIGEVPAGQKVDELTTAYYQRALRPIVEGIERLLDEGLGISRPLGVELDESALLRMDLGKQAEVESKLVGGKIKTPDEARARFGLSPTGGGDTLWGQNQDYPLGMLANRAEWDPDMQPTAAPAAPPAGGDDDDDDSDDEVVRAWLDSIERDLMADIADGWASVLFARGPMDVVKELATRGR
jgi:HK97 family phage portal protein